MNRNRVVTALTALLVLSGCAGAGVSQGQGKQVSSVSFEPFDPNSIIVTEHQITLNGRRYDYLARAGRLAIRDQATGVAHGYIYFTSYVLKVSAGSQPRPISFIWNGGPGSNSLALHFEALGPRRIVESRFIDNDATLLPQSDLVFVDPVGTGFSRPAGTEYEAEFYNALGDIASVAEFIRTYRIVFNVESAPLFAMGESYGVWRAAGVTEALEKSGIHIAGVVAISGGIPFGSAVVPPYIKTANDIPYRTAAAIYHNKAPSDLAALGLDKAMESAKQWASSTYAPALAKKDSLSPAERQEIVRGLSRYTGIPEDKIDPKTLIVTNTQFLRDLVGKPLWTLDMRIPAGGSDRNPERERLLSGYFREDLGYRTDLTYNGLEAGYEPNGKRHPSIGQVWEYNQSGESVSRGVQNAAEGPPGGQQPWLRRAMAIDPNLKVMVATGIYDVYASCIGNDYLVSHLEPNETKNVTTHCYKGGHLMYRDESERPRFSADVAKFVADTIGR